MTPFMPLAVDSFMADCSGLTTEEVGAYILLVNVMWRGGGKPLADNDGLFARFCRMTPKRWIEKIRPSLERLFDVTDGVWRHAGIETQWAFVSRNRANQSEKGKKSAAAKALKNNNTASTVVQPIKEEKEEEGRKERRKEERAREIEDDASAAATAKPKDKGLRLVSDQSKGSAGKGTRLSPEWSILDFPEWGNWAMQEEGMKRSDVMKEADKFRDYWVAKAGADARKASWEATWRNWVRRANSTKGRSSYGRPVEKSDVGIAVFTELCGNPFDTADEQAFAGAYQRYDESSVF